MRMTLPHPQRTSHNEITWTPHKAQNCCKVRTFIKHQQINLFTYSEYFWDVSFRALEREGRVISKGGAEARQSVIKLLKLFAISLSPF